MNNFLLLENSIRKYTAIFPLLNFIRPAKWRTRRRARSVLKIEIEYQYNMITKLYLKFINLLMISQYLNKFWIWFRYHIIFIKFQISAKFCKFTKSKLKSKMFILFHLISTRNIWWNLSPKKIIQDGRIYFFDLQFF